MQNPEHRQNVLLCSPFPIINISRKSIKIRSTLFKLFTLTLWLLYNLPAWWREEGPTEEMIKTKLRQIKMKMAET